MLSHRGQGTILENLYFIRTESKKKLQGAKQKIFYITGDKALLTLIFFRKNAHINVLIHKDIQGIFNQW